MQAQSHEDLQSSGEKVEVTNAEVCVTEPLKTFHDRYTLGKQLGKGSQGIVHSCVNIATGEFHAVKIIDRSSTTAWLTYRREVELCRGFDCKHIIRVQEEFTDATSSCWYLVLEKFEGHLRKGLKFVSTDKRSKVPLGEPHYQLIMRQISRAIHYLHKNSVVHRDVKAHNILLDRLDIRDPRCRLVLTDFGLARNLEPGRHLMAQVGTRKYWAPEVYLSKYWHAVDVFAMGVVFFLAAFWDYPFQNEDETRNLELVQSGQESCRFASLSDGSLGFMKSCLEKEPLRRITAAAAVNHPWIVNSWVAKAARTEKEVAERGASKSKSTVAIGDGFEEEDASLDFFMGPKVPCRDARTSSVRGDLESLNSMEADSVLDEVQCEMTAVQRLQSVASSAIISNSISMTTTATSWPDAIGDRFYFKASRSSPTSRWSRSSRSSTILASEEMREFSC